MKLPKHSDLYLNRLLLLVSKSRALRENYQRLGRESEAYPQARFGKVAILVWNNIDTPQIMKRERDEN